MFRWSAFCVHDADAYLMSADYESINGPIGELDIAIYSGSLGS